MRLLLTGSTGFIGSYFIDNYKNLYEIKKFSFLSDDFTTLDLNNIDTVVHLSALVHHTGKTINKEKYEEINVKQTIKLAKLAKKSMVKHFVFMSTIKVYGEETDSPYTENSACNPKDAYSKSKLKAEIELQKLQNETFIISIIRTPIVYGYGVKANIKSLINLVKKAPILPLGGINNRRSMIYIGNLCYFINIIIAKRIYGIFLVSDEKPIGTTKLVELISEALNKKTYLINIPLFKSILKLIKPSFHQKLYGNLETDNSITKKILDAKIPYSTEESIKYHLC